MFHSARLQLTGWYLLIITLITIFFNITLFAGASAEFDRIERLHTTIERRLELGIPSGPQDFFRLQDDQQAALESRQRLLNRLLSIDACILFLSAVAGYFLAGRTLEPIQKNVDEQNRFISDASHELRTPLTALRTTIEVALRQKNLSIPEAREILRSNLEDIVGLQKLTDGLLQLSTPGLSLTQSPKTSWQVVQQTALKKIQPLTTAKKMLLQVTEKDFSLPGNQELLSELLVILLENAVKYSPEKSTITLKSRVAKKEVVITIADQGIGITTEDLPHIFERFYRADSSRKKQGSSGYGLGLAIAQQIVAFHRGSLTVQSKVGKGSTFTLTLPKSSSPHAL